MINLNESSSFPANVNSLEQTDPASGCDDAGHPNTGIMNQQALALANRTTFLKDSIIARGYAYEPYVHRLTRKSGEWKREKWLWLNTGAYTDVMVARERVVSGVAGDGDGEAFLHCFDIRFNLPAWHEKIDYVVSFSANNSNVNNSFKAYLYAIKPSDGTNYRLAYRETTGAATAWSGTFTNGTPYTIAQDWIVGLSASIYMKKTTLSDEDYVGVDTASIKSKVA